jgi:hypothetical protein
MLSHRVENIQLFRGDSIKTRFRARSGRGSEGALVLKGYLTDLALQPIPVAYIPQVLPLKALRQVPGLSKGLNQLLAQAEEADCWPFFS